jgi:hypothetical protein
MMSFYLLIPSLVTMLIASYPLLDAVRNPDRNHKLWNQLRKNTLYAGTGGILLHTHGQFTMGKLK